MEGYLLGTLFEEEEKEKKQNFYNQIARDEKGHKRFHGAFTGGFQAGYKNTCGSKDGWVPTQFISSRSNRAQYKPQSILQFMDEEDMGQTNIGENLITHQEYSDTLGVKAKETDKLAQNEAENFFGSDIPNELIISTKKDSVGLLILKAMKQASNLGSSNRVIGAFMPEKKPNFDEMKSMVYKDNYKGLGGDDNFEEYDEIDWFSEQFAGLFRKANVEKNEEKETEQERIKNRIKFSGFKDDLENEDYNYEITHEDLDTLQDFKKQAKKRKTLGNPLENYTKSAQPYAIPLHKSLLEIPKDYNPYYRLTQKPKDPSYTPNTHPLSLDQRKALLEDNDPQKPKPLKKISEETKRKILNIKHFVKGSMQDMEGDHIENIFKDKDKQARYLNYCYEKEGKVVGGIAPCNNMTHEQLLAEIQEFEQIFDMFKNYKKEEIQENKGKDPNVLEHRRTFQQWVPDKLVCKRFGVTQPFQGKLAPLNQQNALINKRNVFESQIQPLFESGKRKLEENEDFEDDEVKKKIKTEENEEKEEKKEVSMELFKSIFDTEDD